MLKRWYSFWNTLHNKNKVNILRKRQLYRRFFLLPKQQYQKMVSSLTLLNRRIQTDHEEHLPGILMRQNEQPQHCGHRDLVIECFTVKLEKCLEYFDIVATTEKKNNTIGKNEIHFVFIIYRGVRHWISLKIAIASPDTLITLAFCMTCCWKESTGSMSPANSFEGMKKRISIKLTGASSF